MTTNPAKAVKATTNPVKAVKSKQGKGMTRSPSRSPTPICESMNIVMGKGMTMKKRMKPRTSVVQAMNTRAPKIRNSNIFIRSHDRESIER
jgi:hypothetical protein